MLTYNSNGDMEWSGDGENTDYSTTSSSPNSGRKISHGQDQDSLSDEDDLSDEFSLLDSDDDRRSDIRFSQQIIQVRIFILHLI